MTEAELIEVFTRILRDLLDDESIQLSPATVRADVPDWDSFKYISFIVAVEMQLGIKFGIAEVESFETVGDIAVAARRLLP